MLELLRKLCSIPGAAGFENEVAKEMATEMGKHAVEVTIDPMGNVIGKVSGRRSDHSIMVCAHTDEVGMMVKYIDNDGFVYFDLNGMVDERVLPGTKVVICSESGSYPGVVGARSRHLVTPESLRKPLTVSDLWIDVGAKTGEDVQALGIQIGDPVVYYPNFQELANGFIVSKAIDDRAGCAVLIAVLKELANKKLDYDLYLVGTVQEEVGSRGASVVAHHLKPDLALVIDTVSAGDPSTIPQETTAQLGKGPVLRAMDIMANIRGTIYARKVRNRLMVTAERCGMPYQLDIFRTWTDAATIHTWGIPTGGIYIPRRYSHSPAEVAQISDIENTALLVLEFLKSLTGEDIENLTKRV